MWVFTISWTVACQAPLSMGFCKQEYWSGLSFPSPGNLPKPGIEPRYPRLQVGFLLSELPGNVDSSNRHLRVQLPTPENPRVLHLCLQILLAATHLFSVSMLLPFSQCLRNGIFWDWILSLSQMHLRFIQVGVCIIVHSFLLLSGILLCGYSTV